MNHLNLSSSMISPPIRYLGTLIFTMLLFSPHAKSLSFRYSSFEAKTQGIFYENDSIPTGGKIRLTKNPRHSYSKSPANSTSMNSVGRASYDTAVPLYDNETMELINFTTHFSFEITKLGGDLYNSYGDGLAFFLAPFDSELPVNSSGGCLGLVGSDDSFCKSPSNSSQFVAVEFDNYSNSWDPVGDHVGIDVDSVVSKKTITWDGGFENATAANAWITYDPTSFNLSVFLTFDENPVFNGDSTLWYIIDLRTVLPERVRVGFSAATGRTYEISNIISWEFNSGLSVAGRALAPAPARTPAPAPQPAGRISTSTPPSKLIGLSRKSKSKVGLVGGVVGGVSVLSIALSLVGFMWWKRRSIPKNDNMGSEISDDFVKETGPRRFTYGELSHATDNFCEERKLGEGGFGDVYFGWLKNPNREIAVKKVSKGSRQGKKEYVSEVKIISQLRHKNLVQLLGWCHEGGDLLLVYEFMPNGSLDSHLYGGRKDALSWTMRYKIALHLASAILYLHEEWEQCVLHRDIKSSNVMLDSNFNAKLGDFGLARLVDPELGSQTTVLAGTLGYLAPECAITGKASKDSDMYSFGVVALEIACGRQPIEPSEEPTKVTMIEWVWDLYGKGCLLEAIDQRLEGEFDAHQTECLMTVGLWCCHPDYTRRPSISQVIKVLKFEVPLPVLSSTFPVPIYSSTPMVMDVSSISSSLGYSSNGTGAASSSSHSHVSGRTTLMSEKANE